MKSLVLKNQWDKFVEIKVYKVSVVLVLNVALLGCRTFQVYVCYTIDYLF